MKKILCLLLLIEIVVSSAYALCSVYKDKTTCDVFGKPMCRWDGAGQCVAGRAPDAKQSTIEGTPFVYDLKRKQPKQAELSKESKDELPPPE
jgi:hypothetical protein